MIKFPGILHFVFINFTKMIKCFLNMPLYKFSMTFCQLKHFTNCPFKKVKYSGNLVLFWVIFVILGPFFWVYKSYEKICGFKWQTFWTYFLGKVSLRKIKNFFSKNHEGNDFGRSIKKFPWWEERLLEIKSLFIVNWEKFGEEYHLKRITPKPQNPNHYFRGILLAKRAYSHK